MKKLILIASIAFFAISHLFAQKDFEGIITYRSSQYGKAAHSQNTKIPKEIKTYYKNGKMRMELTNSQMTFVILTDSKKQDAALLLEAKEMMGMKIAIKTDKDEIKEMINELNNPQIKYLNQHKEIAGYPCEHILIKTSDGEFNGYATKKLKAGGINWLFSNEIEGVMLEYAIRSHKSGDYIMLRAQDVLAKELPSSLFNIPIDYIPISISDAEGMVKDQVAF